MASEAIRYNHFHAGVIFTELMVKKVQYNENGTFDIFGDKKISNYQAESLLRNAKRLHDETLMHNGTIGVAHRCRSIPFGKNITNLKAPFEKKMHIPELIGRAALNPFMNLHNTSEKNYFALKLASQLQSEKLCLGSKFQVEIQHIIDYQNNAL